MALKYRSLCSGSSGNSALLWTDTSAILVDFAPGCQRDCREALRQAAKICGQVDSVLITHAHGDHINANSLRVLHEAGVKARCHPEVYAQIKTRHGARYAETLSPFEDDLAMGNLKVRQIRVPHAPNCYTSAFSVTTRKRGRDYKAAIFTDLSGFTREHVVFAADSDLLFLEANHDLELLKECGHPGSEFHLSNYATAEFLYLICKASAAQPQAVVLGHLSTDCNTAYLPPKEIEIYFSGTGMPVKFKTLVANRHEPGRILDIV